MRRMLLPVVVLLGAALLAAGVGVAADPAVAATTAVVNVDGSRPQQVISGLGVNLDSHEWAGGALKPAIDQLADRMGARVFRVVIEKADWEATNDNADPNVFDDAYYNQLYATATFTDLWSTIAYLNTKGVTVSLSVMGAAPAWMGGSDLTPGKEAEYAETIASLVRYARVTKGLDVKLVEPLNELDWDGKEGVRATPQQAVTVLRLLGQRLDALGLSDVRFVTPDTADVSRGTGDYLTALLADSYVVSKVAHVGLHDYSGSTGGAASKLPVTTDFWMTEFSAWCDGCDSGAPNPANWPFARQTGQYLLSMISQGAGGALVWDGVDGYYEHHNSVTYWGMLSGGGGRGAYLPRKTFSVMAQVMAYVPTGSRLLTTSTADPDLDVEAFRDPVTGRLTVTGFNLSAAAKTVTVTGLSGYQSFMQVQTSASADLAPSSVTATGGQATVTVPADTMFTLSGTPAASAVYVLPSSDTAAVLGGLAAAGTGLTVIPSSRAAGTFTSPGCSTTTSPLPRTDPDLVSMLGGGSYTNTGSTTTSPLTPDCLPDAVSLRSPGK